tara:strand:- start:573 stop:752 length:180 start_codon:yes stop_codon:yes gene_type:complete
MILSEEINYRETLKRFRKKPFQEIMETRFLVNKEANFEVQMAILDFQNKISEIDLFLIR